MNDAFQMRFEKLRDHIKAGELEGVILTPGPNLRYYTGVKSALLERQFLLFVPRDGTPHLLAPTFEASPFTRISMKIAIHAWTDTEGPLHAYQDVISGLGLKGKWGVEGRVPYHYIHPLTSQSNLQLEDAEQILQNIREIKEPVELQSHQRAASILSKAFLKIPGFIRPRMTEIELGNRITQEVYSNGADSVEVMLVQAGASAADPHHMPEQKKIQRKESIVVDGCCTYAGYFADITRTYMIGRDSEFENVYENVLDSQKEGIRASKPGAKVGQVDEAARSRLRQKNLDKYFTHRTGHGLGLEVHEAPYIVPNGEETLQPGMVYTVEPGVYLAGKMGVRIEDNVQVTEDGAKVLTRSLPKELGWWRK